METKTNTERRSAVITSDNSNLSIGAVMWVEVEHFRGSSSRRLQNVLVG